MQFVFSEIDSNNNYDQNEDMDVEDIGFIDESGVLQNENLNIPKPILKRQQNIFSNMISPINRSPRKRVTYDDILASMNMKFINGSLQVVKPEPEIINNQYQENPNNIPIIEEYPPIYMNTIPNEEYKRQIAIQYIKNQLELQRVNEIKSRKLRFSTNNIKIAPTGGNTLHLLGFKPQKTSIKFK